MIKNRTIDQSTIVSFWQAAGRHSKLLIGSCLSPLASIGMGVAIPYMIGKILGSLSQPTSDVQAYIIILVVVCVLTLVLNQISFRSLFALEAIVVADLETESLNMLLQRGARFHNGHISGKLVSDVNDYVMAFIQLANSAFIDILPFGAVVVTGITLVAINSPFLAIILLAMTAMVILWTMRFRQRMRPFRQQRQAAGKAVIGHIADTIVNNQTVKSFSREEHEMQRHTELGTTLRQLRMKDWRAMANDGTYRMIGLFVFEILFVLVLVWEVRRNPTLLATGIFAFSYTVTLSNRLFQIGNMMRQAEESLLQAAPMTEYRQQPVEINDISGALALQPMGGAVEFKQVGFHYADSNSKNTIFQSLDLAIGGGEKIGLVGPSGGGKSTLTKLLLRFEDLTAGSITIDGQDIADVTQASLRQSIAYVAQEPLLFHRSIRDNIAYGDPSATMEEVRTAAQKAYADEFINQLPDGYDTIVGERGVKLSGGQRQRIAIARAILKDAPILLLDEATSALDSASEQVIQTALNDLMEHKTAIVIAHRLSTIQKMDRIIVIDNGTVLEQGSHSELLASKGVYAKLWAHQSGGFLPA